MSNSRIYIKPGKVVAFFAMDSWVPYALHRMRGGLRVHCMARDDCVLGKTLSAYQFERTTSRHVIWWILRVLSKAGGI